MNSQNNQNNRTSTTHKPQPAEHVKISAKSIGVLERDHTTALLLSIFLGIFGIDQFYLGKTGKGLLKLFTLGLFGILWLIDVIMIATKSVNGVAWKEEAMADKATSGNWFKKHKALSIVGGFILLIIIVAIANGGNKTAKTNTAAVTSGDYTNASQIVQVLKAHNVPVTNVTKDTGLTSFTGATSGVWVEAAPGDSAAQFGGSANAGTDTEIVVFKNHADAIAYVNIGNSAEHQSILGTNWAIDAASPAVAGIRAVLGGTLAGSTTKPSTPTSTTKVATRQVTGTTVTLGAGTFSGGKDVAVGLYDVTPGAGQSGNFTVSGNDSYNEILGGGDVSLGDVPKIRVQISSGDQIQISSLSSVTFTPVTAAFVTTHAAASLYAGTFTVGQDIGAGRYVVTPGSGQSGNFTVSGNDSYNEILGSDSSMGDVPSTPPTLKRGIQMLQLNAGIRCSELPVNRGVLFVSGCRPGSHLLFQL